MLYAELLGDSAACDVFEKFTEICGGHFVSEITSGDTLYDVTIRRGARIPYEENTAAFLDLLRESISTGKNLVLEKYPKLKPLPPDILI